MKLRRRRPPSSGPQVPQVLELTCKACGTSTRQPPCPNCGGQSFDAAPFEATLSFSTRFVAKARHPGRRPFIELEQRDRWSHDRQRVERRTLLFDRDERENTQEWRDKETGEVAFRKSGDIEEPATFGKSAHPSRSDPTLRRALIRLLTRLLTSPTKRSLKAPNGTQRGSGRKPT